MAFVVTESCIKCKYMDCVEVCPVDCFHEGPNFLVIDPDECIDCTLCEPECPVEAIFSEEEIPGRPGELPAAERGTRQEMAGDQREEGKPPPTPSNGKASRTSSNCWSDDAGGPVGIAARRYAGASASPSAAALSCLHAVRCGGM